MNCHFSKKNPYKKREKKMTVKEVLHFFLANHQGSTSCPEEVVELSLIPKLKVAERYNAMHNRPCVKHDIPPMD